MPKLMKTQKSTQLNIYKERAARWEVEARSEAHERMKAIAELHKTILDRNKLICAMIDTFHDLTRDHMARIDAAEWYKHYLKKATRMGIEPKPKVVKSELKLASGKTVYVGTINSYDRIHHQSMKTKTKKYWAWRCEACGKIVSKPDPGEFKPAAVSVDSWCPHCNRVTRQTTDQ